jgi:hypothetical protein
VRALLAVVARGRPGGNDQPIATKHPADVRSVTRTRRRDVKWRRCGLPKTLVQPDNITTSRTHSEYVSEPVPTRLDCRKTQ